MGGTLVIKPKPFLKRWKHKLFNCPTFWKLKTSFNCPKCKKTYRCYWDGNDVSGHGVDYCNKCTKILEGASEEGKSNA